MGHCSRLDDAAELGGITMAGRKKTPCEFCSENAQWDDLGYVEGRNGFCIWLEIYPMNNVMSMMGQANDEDGFMQEAHFDVQMNYCPVCGRKLVD